jgi:hypothetical protein
LAASTEERLAFEQMGICRRIILVLVLVLAAGCDYYAKPYRPLPATFAVATLDDRSVTREAMRGKPWVINVWLPG